MSIGKRIRELREQKGISQDELEKTSGLSRAYLSRLERGHADPTLTTLEKLAKALDTPLHRLISRGKRSASKGLAAEDKVKHTRIPLTEDDRFVFSVLARAFAKM